MYNNKINSDTFLDERKKNLGKIKQKRNNYEIEQQAIYACEKERERSRKLLYKWLTFKHSLKCLIKFDL
uniref:Uncharacterized protein n=1 Tax=viral metagenome TaxID=1070528 RepID=A0A6C0B5W3_9ZZZZ